MSADDRLSDAELLDVDEEIREPNAERRGNIQIAANFLRRALAELLARRGLACPSCHSQRVGAFDDIGAHVWFERTCPTSQITDHFCHHCHHTWNRT